MPLVPTGVHCAIDRGAIVYLIQLVNGQGIHVGADSDSFRASLAHVAAQQGNHARFSDTRLYLQSKCTQALCYNTRGTHLFKCKFGMFMQVATQRYQIGNEFINIRFQAIRFRHSFSWLTRFSARKFKRKNQIEFTVLISYHINIRSGFWQKEMEKKLGQIDVPTAILAVVRGSFICYYILYSNI